MINRSRALFHLHDIDGVGDIPTLGSFAPKLSPAMRMAEMRDTIGEIYDGTRLKQPCTQVLRQVSIRILSLCIRVVRHHRRE